MRIRAEQYKNIRRHMLPGDIIAFSGRSLFSRFVKLATRSEVSHVGIVCISDVCGNCGHTVEIMESVKEAVDPDTGQIITGVTRNRLSSRLRHYEGEMYWFQLSHDTRQALDIPAAVQFLMSVHGLPYDMPQAVLSALDLLDNFPLKLTYAVQDFSAFFCSELAAAALIAGGVLPSSVNASEMTPVDLLRQPVFFKHYYQLTGAHKPLKLTKRNTAK